jgi:hypothetical protein
MMKGLIKDKNEEERLVEDLMRGDMKDLKEAEQILFDKNLKYREKRGMKWITMIVGTVLFGILGWLIMPLFTKLTNSFYDRTGLEQVTKDLFGTFKITDTLTDEIMIVTYDMQNHVPVIFTKDAARKNETMNVYIRDAA